MNYYSEKDIRDIVADVITREQAFGGKKSAPCACADPIPVEISARHVHLTEAAIEKLFGRGYKLTRKRDLSQPGQFLSEERVKLVTQKGEFSNVAVLGPARKAVQVELSATDARTLGIKAPLRLSGDLSGAAGMLIIGPAGIVEAGECAIVAQAHIHMTPADAKKYGVKDGQKLSVRLDTTRPLTLDSVIARVTDASKLAIHIDFDEANAAMVDNSTTGTIVDCR